MMSLGKYAIKLADRPYVSRGMVYMPRPSAPQPPPPPVKRMDGWFDTTPSDSWNNRLRPMRVFDPAIPPKLDKRYTGVLGRLRSALSRGPLTTSFDTSRYKPSGVGDYVILFEGSGSGNGGPSRFAVDPEGAYGEGNYAQFTWRQIPEAMKFVESLPKGSRLHVVGHSMGGAAALDFARQAEKRGIGISGLDLRDPVRINGRLRNAVSKVFPSLKENYSVPGNVARANNTYNAGWINHMASPRDMFGLDDVISLLGGRMNAVTGAKNNPRRGSSHVDIGQVRWMPPFYVSQGWVRDSGRSSAQRAMNAALEREKDLREARKAQEEFDRNLEAHREKAKAMPGPSVASK